MLAHTLYITCEDGQQFVFESIRFSDFSTDQGVVIELLVDYVVTLDPSGDPIYDCFIFFGISAKKSIKNYEISAKILIDIRPVPRFISDIS